jgi:hypothetical protein
MCLGDRTTEAALLRPRRRLNLGPGWHRGEQRSHGLLGYVAGSTGSEPRVFDFEAVFEVGFLVVLSAVAGRVGSVEGICLGAWMVEEPGQSSASKVFQV